MAAEARDHRDYTVGWICALSKEQTAAIAMLDERHPKLPKLRNDDNTYTLGSIGSHNIVITCLPQGKVATVSAATVAAHLIHAFPAVKFALMVGIGGGIPPKVRLGDVIVGVPTLHYPGVVQWDLGKAEKGGNFTRTGSLDNPPRSLLSAISELRSEWELGEPKLQQYLKDMASNHPKLASKYLRSESLQDVLFKAAYEHNATPDSTGPRSSETEEEEAKENEEEDEEGENCRYCDETQVVRRKPREMRVHYGLIASGNSVIKDAKFRDNLRRDLGPDLLCVEMEAAGLMQDFPCLLIRGICDYADSHKNKGWQEHAAAVAAAYAKELLGYVQPSDIYEEKTAKDTMNHISDALESIKKDATHTKSRLLEKEWLEILDWLISPDHDYGPQQSDTFGRRQPGTGQWLLESGEYQQWIQTPNKTLFCRGIPGAGKTILTSVVVNDLETRFRSEDVSIVYVYCNYKRQNEQTVENLLSSLLKQLASYLPSLPRCITELHERHSLKRTRPFVDEVLQALESVIAQSSRVIIVIDALDECQASTRKKLLSRIFELQGNVNLFATSRDLPDITQHFKESFTIEIRATEGDIRKYLSEQEFPDCISEHPDWRLEVINRITTAADGMFLLAELHFASIKYKDTWKAVQTVLQALSTGSNTYDDAYQSIIKRIQSQPHDQAERAKQVLAWIVFSERQLTPLELLHALAIEIDEPEFDKCNIPGIKSVVSVSNKMLSSLLEHSNNMKPSCSLGMCWYGYI
ncbi:nucleoside phosphorylase domain-containing protein [Xylariaceae sp. FL0255]|nr:nucleoside phosphorylase domain-containing protein [Xylariaceae sp. FL0255]